MSQCITRNSIRAGTIDDNFTFLDNSGNSNPITRPTTHPPTPANMSHLHIDPADDDTPVTNSQADATAIAEAISKVLKTNNSKPKLREPDPFDGSDPCKLCTFILQCKLNFRDRKDAFEDDSDKVNYILSYLKGTALDCFESAVLDPIEPLWLSDFDHFIEELEANFGTYDPIGKAEAELEGLRMHDSHQATKYFIKFQQLAARVQWGDAALRHQAYNGLAKHIKDDMVHHEKLNTLVGLRKLVQAIDARYWERKGELSHETRASRFSGNKSEHKSDSNKSDNKSGKGSSNSKQNNNNAGSTQGKGSSSEQKKSPTPDLSSKLGKDRKLTPQEHQRHLDNKLFLFCGTAGHVAKDCPKSSSASAKARVSKSDQDKFASSGMDLKKD